MTRLTEHATGPDFTPREALDALAEARRYEEPLRQRTEGLTWIVWGIVTPAIFLTYHAAALAFGNAWPWWSGLLWAPWVAFGLIATFALWSTAALAAPALAEKDEHGPLVGLVWLALMGGTALLHTYGHLDLPPPTLWVLGVASAWTLLGVFNWYGASPTGRKVHVAIGGTYLAVGLALALSGLHVEAASVVAMVLGGVIPVTGGLWQVVRG